MKTYLFYFLLLMNVFIINGKKIELVELIKINPNIKLDIRYATKNNFTGKQVYSSAKCYLQKSAALALDEVQKELEKQGLGLKIYDCYRPFSVQKIFWEICPDARYVADPKVGSKHNRGTAVDLTLIDLKTGEELEMPSLYDDFSEKASRNCKKMSEKARKNCKLLEKIMKKHKFVPQPTEWWHFDYKGWKDFDILDIKIEDLK